MDVMSVAGVTILIGVIFAVIGILSGYCIGYKAGYKDATKKKFYSIANSVRRKWYYRPVYIYKNGRHGRRSVNGHNMRR